MNTLNNQLLEKVISFEILSSTSFIYLCYYFIYASTKYVLEAHLLSFQEIITIYVRT